MQLPFPLVEEPDQLTAERGRKLFAGQTDFLKGVVAEAQEIAEPCLPTAIPHRGQPGDAQWGKHRVARAGQRGLE